MFSLIRALFLPSLHGGLLPFVRLVHQYFGAIRLLRVVHAPCGSAPSRTGLDPGGTETPGDLLVLVPIVSQRAWVLRLSGAD